MKTLFQEELVKLQPKGLITLPIRFRRELGLEENGIVRIKKDKGRLIVEPVKTLPYPIRTYTKDEIEEFLALDKDESLQLKKKGYLK